MASDVFLIGPYQVGLQKNMKPWAIPEEAFSKLENAYVYRGRVRKRPGSLTLGSIFNLSSLSSRLSINLGNTDGSGNISGTVPGATFKQGQMFSIGAEIFTVATSGAADMLTTGSATTHTYNTGTGAYNIQGAAAATDCYFYPAEPVMGFTFYEDANINDEPTYAFDTQFSYKYASGGWTRLNTGGAAALWTGSDSDFFWSTNYRGATSNINILFVSNFNAADQIRYWNGTTWAAMNPAFLAAANNTIETARIIIPFKDRLILLNTKEYVSAVLNSFPNRCRFSQNGSPLAADAFREDIPGKGGFLDAPIQEAIISAQLLRDRLIVFFERSTWELVYTGNQILPFVWQQINIELGAESTFSIVAFDKVILGIGNNGIHACNGANVERIDLKVPDEVFEFHNNNDAPQRVHGIREYQTEMVYWAVPSVFNTSSLPNKILAFNYANKSWATFDDSITAFGYFWNEADITWQSYAESWQAISAQWDDGLFEGQYRNVIAGNQQGYTFLIIPDLTFNSRSLQITNITESSGVVTLTIYNHNLKSGDWIFIESCVGFTELNGKNFKVEYVNDDTITIDNAPAVTGTYAGGGEAGRISKIDIETKDFNFYSKKGSNTFIHKADFYVDNTVDGQITVDYAKSASLLYLRQFSVNTNTNMGTGILETSPYTTITEETFQERFWHAVYTQVEGESVKIRIYLSDEQMEDDFIPFVDFQMHAMLIHASETFEL